MVVGVLREGDALALQQADGGGHASGFPEIGGSSSTNAMAYVRGHRGDYDRWAEAGLPHWSFAHVLPYFRRQEAWEEGAGPYRGADGPLTTRWSR